MLFFTLSWVFAQVPKIKYEVIKSCEFTYYPYLHDTILKILNTGEILQNKGEYRVSIDNENDNKLFIRLVDNIDLKGCIDSENIKIAENDQTSIALKNRNWVAKYVVEALTKKDINIVFENEGNVPRYASTNPTDFGDFEPWQQYMNIPTLSITNVDINIKFSIDRYLGVFTQINNEEYLSYSLSVWNYVGGKYLENIRQGETYKLTFKLDGDYLDLYVNNQFLITFVDVDKRISEQYLNFVKSKSYSLDNITWPRHADGSCDYEKGNTLVASSSSATNVSINKTMSVKENLKLRSAEATSSNVLIVMSAGTKVKIIELGKEETIDGINSNWVKVEVISGKDRDGNKLKVGLSGWCYGGYLE